MTKSKKSNSKKKPTTAKKKPAVKKIPDKIEIDIPTVEEVKDVITDTFKAVQADNWNITPAVKKGFVTRVKSWFKFW